MNKILVNVSMCTLFIFFQNSFSTSEMTHDEIKDYVTETLERLFLSQELDPTAQNDIDLITKAVLAQTIRPSLWKRVFGSQTEWTTDDIKAKIISCIINFVERQSYQYAYEKTDCPFIASKVAQNMKNTITKRTCTQSKFQSGCLSRFIGKKLYDSIEEQCSRFEVIHDTKPINVVKCRLCQTSYIELECIELYPCGHQVCKNCAEEQLLKQQIARCPNCSKSIDVDSLRNKLFEPSEKI